MSDLRNMQQVDTRAIHGTRGNSKVTLAAAGAVATVATTGTNTYLVDGVFYSFAAWTVQSVAVTHSMFGQPVAVQPAYVQPAGTTVYYVLGLNAAGTVCSVQGSYAGQPIAAVSGVSQATIGVGGLPVMPAGFAPIGMVKVVTTVAATFTAGTTLWNAANVAATAYDLSMLPSVAP